MPSKRKHNPAYIPTTTTVKSHSRTVYKRKKFHISNFTKKSSNKKKRGGSALAAGKAIGEVLLPLVKDQAKGMWDLAKRRKKEHADAIRRFYYGGS